jgi:L-iditol 2-dehydrogenase
VRVARPAGRCVLTGISGHEEDPLPVSDARRKELTLRWCRRFRFNYPAAIALLADGRVDVASLITHSFPLERCPEALALVSETGDGVLKVSIDQ